MSSSSDSLTSVFLVIGIPNRAAPNDSLDELSREIGAFLEYCRQLAPVLEL